MMAKALVIYTTRTNQTKSIAELIAEGLRMAGVEAVMANVNAVEKKGLKAEDFDAVVLGSPTYHGEMVQAMKTFLFKLEQANLEGKVGGAFGAFGWSGEALERIFETMTHIFKMNMVSGPLRLKSAALGGGIQMAQGYGKEVAQKIGA